MTMTPKPKQAVAAGMPERLSLFNELEAVDASGTIGLEARAFDKTQHKQSKALLAETVHRYNTQPDLYAACKAALPHYKVAAVMGDTESQAIAQKLMDAIKKAEGI